MAATIIHKLDAPAAVATGVASPMGDLRRMTVHVGGTFVASMRVQISADGVSYANLSPVFSATTFFTADVLAMWVRVVTTAYTSGTPEVFIVGEY